MRKETDDMVILLTSTDGDRKIVQPARITSGPTKIARKWNELTHFRLTSIKVIPIKKGFRLARCSREVASVGPRVLHTRFCSLSNIFK